jgi:MerR family transcriptional regulator, light-induced transcriptional regulator
MDRYQPQETALEELGRTEPDTESEPCAPEPALGPMPGWPLASPGRGWLGSAIGPTPEERLARLVRTIESDIIPRLVRAHQPPDRPTLEEAAGSRSPAAQFPPADVRIFTALVLAGSDADLFGHIDQLVVQGCTIESLYLDLIAPTARNLGQMWADDLCNFADVTIATGRLQQILRRLSPAFGRTVQVPQDGRRLLLLPAPGEQHTLGLAMVADFFSRAGWHVSNGGITTLADGAGGFAGVADAIRQVRDDWFDVVGFSLGRSSGLSGLARLVGQLRRASRNRGIGILVGGPVFAEDPALVARVGADAMARTGQDAPAVAEGLLASRTSRIA